MLSCFSLESVDIEAAYREQEYMRDAEEYRFLHDVMSGNQESKNRMQQRNSFFQRIYSNSRYLWLKHVNILSGKEVHDSLPYYYGTRKVR